MAVAERQRERMSWIATGPFRMGSEDFYPEEAPVREVAVQGFWMDEHAVTAADYRRFVRETGYVTVAERPLDPKDYPAADPELLVPGSLVFRKTAGPVPLDDHRNWWEYVPGASWRRPGGPGRRSTAATGTRSCRSPTRTRRPTQPGRERSSRPKPSGSTRRAAGSTAPHLPGATSTSRTEHQPRTPGKGSSPGRTSRRTDSGARIRSGASRRTATGSTT